jgi:AraC-like DNA-binding protein
MAVLIAVMTILDPNSQNGALTTMNGNENEQPPYISRQVQASRRFYFGAKTTLSDDLFVICGGWERTTPDYFIRRDSFPWLAVEYVADGRGRVVFGGRSHELEQGSFYAYGPDMTHQMESNPQRVLSKYYINFGGREAANLLRAVRMNPGECRVVANPKEVRSAFDQLIDDGARNRPQAQKIAALQLHVLLLKLGADYSDAGSVDPRARQTLRTCIDYMDRHFVETATAEEVAQACHVSPNHMTRLFRRFGYPPPYEYLVRKKMFHAAELFDSGNLLVREVAEGLGMDPFQFSRVFKRVHGLSPSAFIGRHGF